MQKERGIITWDGGERLFQRCRSGCETKNPGVFKFSWLSSSVANWITSTGKTT